MFLKVVNLKKEDWNTLIILDACRYDLFKEFGCPKLDGKLEARWSTASCTPDWIETQIGSRRDDNSFKDVTYIAANPNFPMRYMVKKVEPVWNYGWDNEKLTVLPRIMFNAFLKLKFEKRILLHFLQPHYPFLDGEELAIGVRDSWNDIENEEDFIKTKNAYKLCLQSVMPCVKKIINLRRKFGRMIITADHGESYEKPYANHPCGSDKFGLRLVPWFVIESNNVV